MAGAPECQKSQDSQENRSAASTLQQTPTERGVADRSDMNGHTMARAPSSLAPLLVHVTQPATTDEFSPSNRSPSNDPAEHYKPELQQLVRWLRERFPPDLPDRIEFFLPLEQYRQFKELVQGGEFAGAKLKYDYSFDREILALRMANDEHQVIVEFLKEHMTRFINQAKQHPDPFIGGFASSLVSTNSGYVQYLFGSNKGKTECRPDLSFRTLENPKYPTLVGQVTISQDTKALEDLAREYVESSRGNIRTVIAFGLDGPGGKGARVLVWRMQFDAYGSDRGVTCETVEIRSKDGVKNPNGQVGLALSLKDFARPGAEIEYRGFESLTMTVSMDDLHAVVERAEFVDQLIKVLHGE